MLNYRSNQPKRNVTLVYSRFKNDQRTFGTNPYIPHFLEIFANRCKDHIEDAKKRVKFTGGRYYYRPSAEYFEFIRRFKGK